MTASRDHSVQVFAACQVPSTHVTKKSGPQRWPGPYRHSELPPSSGGVHGVPMFGASTGHPSPAPKHCQCTPPSRPGEHWQTRASLVKHGFRLAGISFLVLGVVCEFVCLFMKDSRRKKALEVSGILLFLAMANPS